MVTQEWNQALAEPKIHAVNIYPDVCHGKERQGSRTAFYPLPLGWKRAKNRMGNLL